MLTGRPYPEVIDAVGGGGLEGNLLSSSPRQDDLQPLHHAAACGHGVVLIFASQEDGSAPVPVEPNIHICQDSVLCAPLHASAAAAARQHL